MNEINKLTEQVNQDKKSQIAADINQVFTALVVDPSRARLPENVFVFHFLPFFSGELNNPALAGRNVVTDWISIAGSPMGQVDVFDATGAVVFTVPSLFDTNIIEIVNRKPGNALSDLFYQYDMRSNVPNAANNYLTSALFAKGQEITNNQSSLLNSKTAWESILQRYGKIIPTAVATSQNAAPNDDVVYD